MLRVTMAAALVVGAMAMFPSTAAAQPETAPCDYNLSAPHVVRVGSTDMVAVTMAPAGCDGATPYMSVACVQLEGSPGPGRCRQNNGPLTAVVYYSPYQPGATYVATGRGCATKGNPPQPFCGTTGPVTATL
ncbi:hypothetical protein [Mycolicibacterium rutilum]|nr:hypothetical protein [Mycolicibacterium rutilum]